MKSLSADLLCSISLVDAVPVAPLPLCNCKRTNQKDGALAHGILLTRVSSPYLSGERTREGIGARIPPRKPKPLNPPPSKGGVQNAVKIGLAGLVLLAVAAGLAVYGMGTGDERAPRKPSGRVMDAEAVARNRQMAIDMFYHSYDNYMRHAFREKCRRPESHRVNPCKVSARLAGSRRSTHSV